MQGEVVGFLTAVSLFGAVKAGIPVPDCFGNGQEGLQVVVVGGVAGVSHIFDEGLRFGQSAEEHFGTDEERQHSRDGIGRPFCAPGNAEQDKVGKQAEQPQPHRGERAHGIEVVGVGLLIGERQQVFQNGGAQCLQNQNIDRPPGGDKQQRFAGNEIYLCERPVCQRQQEEAEHETVTIVEPVWLLEAVPDEVEITDREGEDEEENEASGGDLFPVGEFPAEEEGRRHQDGQHAAVNEGQTRRADGVIGGGKELVEQEVKVKLLRYVPIRIGEVVLAEAERVLGRQDRQRRHAYGESRPQSHAPDRLGKVIAFAHRVVLVVTVVGEVVEEAVSDNVNARHVADVVVAVQRNREREYEQAEVPLPDQFLQPVGEQRQPDHDIQPHGVALVLNRIRAERVHGGEGNNRQPIGLSVAVAVQVEAHSQPHQSGFEREERQESLQHPRYGEQRNDPGKRTCHIVVKNTEKFPAQFTGEGVEQTAVSVHEIPQGVIEADILRVQIQRQHAVIPERMHTLRNVQEQKKYGGHASGNEQVAVLKPPRAETAAEAGQARFGSGCIAGFVHGNIRLILIHGSDYPFFFKRRVLSVAFGCIRGRFHPPHRFLKPQAVNSHVPPATEAEYPHLTACAQYAEAGRAAGMLLFQLQHIAGVHSDDRQRAPPFSCILRNLSRLL